MSYVPPTKEFVLENISGMKFHEKIKYGEFETLIFFAYLVTGIYKDFESGW